MAKTPSLSIIFPCYNDEKSIGQLVTTANEVAGKLTDDFEIIVVDDGSADNSVSLITSHQSQITNLKLITHKKNQGYGATLRTGFKAATKELVFYTDGDGQYDVKELPILFSLMTSDVNFVNGIKMFRHDFAYRIILGNLYSFIARWLFLLPIQDVDCDFRLIRINLLNKLKLYGNSGSICIELVKKAQREKAKFRQVSIHHFERAYGASQFFRPKHLFTTFKEIIILWLNLMILSH